MALGHYSVASLGRIFLVFVENTHDALCLDKFGKFKFYQVKKIDFSLANFPDLAISHTFFHYLKIHY